MVKWCITVKVPVVTLRITIKLCVFACTQDEKNQIINTNLWLNLVSHVQCIYRQYVSAPYVYPLCHYRTQSYKKNFVLLLSVLFFVACC